MTVVINGTTGISTPGMSSTADVTLAGSGVDILNNSGNKVLGQAGSVIQVVQGTYATQVYNGTNTFADSGLSASITPTSSSSKILIFVSSVLYSQRSASDTGSKLQLVRGSTNIYTQLNSTLYIAAGGAVAEIITNAFVQYFDSPATTSSTTYKLQFASNTSCNSYINWNNQAGYMTLMEIAV